MAADHYKVLGLDPNCSFDEIKKAYRKIALIHHPDKNRGDVEIFKSALEAHNVLSNPELRASYDREMGFTFENKQFNGVSSFEFGDIILEFGRTESTVRNYSNGFRATAATSKTHRPSTNRPPPGSGFSTPRRRPTAPKEDPPMSEKPSDTPESSSSKRYFSNKGTWKSKMNEAYEKSKSNPTVIDLTDILDDTDAEIDELSDTEQQPKATKKASKTQSDTEIAPEKQDKTPTNSKRANKSEDNKLPSYAAHPSKRSRLDMDGIRHVHPMNQKFNNFDLNDLGEVVPDAEEVLIEPTEEKFASAPPLEQEYIGPHHKLPMGTYVPMQSQHIRVPQPPIIPDGRSPDIIGASRRYLEAFKIYYADYIDYSTMVSGAMYQGHQALGQRGLSEVLSRQRVGQLIESGIEDIAIMEQYVENMKKHMNTLYDFYKQF